MKQLINPDRPDYFIARLEWINHKVSAEEHSGSKQGWMREEQEHSRIGGTMIKVDLPAPPLLDTHPGALKGKITEKVACQPDQQCRSRDIDERGEHGHSFSSTKCSVLRV